MKIPLLILRPVFKSIHTYATMTSMSANGSLVCSTLPTHAALQITQNYPHMLYVIHLNNLPHFPFQTLTEIYPISNPEISFILTRQTMCTSFLTKEHQKLSVMSDSSWTLDGKRRDAPCPKISLRPFSWPSNTYQVRC